MNFIEFGDTRTTALKLYKILIFLIQNVEAT